MLTIYFEEVSFFLKEQIAEVSVWHMIWYNLLYYLPQNFQPVFMFSFGLATEKSNKDTI